MTPVEERNKILNNCTAVEYFNNLIKLRELTLEDLPVGALKTEGRARSVLLRFIQRKQEENNTLLQAYLKYTGWEQDILASQSYNAHIGECGYSDWTGAIESMYDKQEVPEYPLTLEETELAIE